MKRIFLLSAMALACGAAWAQLEPSPVPPPPCPDYAVVYSCPTGDGTTYESPTPQVGCTVAKVIR